MDRSRGGGMQMPLGGGGQFGHRPPQPGGPWAVAASSVIAHHSPEAHGVAKEAAKVVVAVGRKGRVVVETDILCSSVLRQ